MSAVDIDHEVKARILGFTRQRERVTIDDIRREFFPGQMGAPYYYLDQLREDGHLWVILSDGPMTWTTADYARKHRGMGALKKHREEKAVKRQAKSHAECAHPLKRAELRKCMEARKEGNRKRLATAREASPAIDPELLGWVRDFIFQRESVSLACVAEEFFPGEFHTAQSYLDQLKAEGVIKWNPQGQVYKWAYSSRPQKISRPKAKTFADGEVHEMTWREIQERFGYGEFRQIRNFFRGHARSRGDIQLSIQKTSTGVKFCMGVPPLKWEAPRRGGRRREARS
ncbi:hypothetical protein [Streptomyces sp. NPDC057623]|uniref:hypothetical protein n=1 Tax=Streptomyces sp. NPDC057623 TaxID=3346187 RepID=UPI0036859699